MPQLALPQPRARPTANKLENVQGQLSSPPSARLRSSLVPPIKRISQNRDSDKVPDQNLPIRRLRQAMDSKPREEQKNQEKQFTITHTNDSAHLKISRGNGAKRINCLTTKDLEHPAMVGRNQRMINRPPAKRVQDRKVREATNKTQINISVYQLLSGLKKHPSPPNPTSPRSSAFSCCQPKPIARPERTLRSDDLLLREQCTCLSRTP